MSGALILPTEMRTIYFLSSNATADLCPILLANGWTQLQHHVHQLHQQLQFLPPHHYSLHPLMNVSFLGAIRRRVIWEGGIVCLLQAYHKHLLFVRHEVLSGTLVNWPVMLYLLQEFLLLAL